MPPDPPLPRACVGCLDTRQCWICGGDGCHRCTASGRCHLCAAPDRVLDLIPLQPAADRDSVAS